MEVIKAIIFGIVEGLTEWLPISSTGHMILLNQWLHLNTSEAFWEMFLVVIQLGAILAVIVLYFKEMLPFSIRPGSGNNSTNGGQSGCGNRSTSGGRSAYISRSTDSSRPKKRKLQWNRDVLMLWLKTAVAVLPAVIVALPFDDRINDLFYTPLTVAMTLIAYGILFILIEHWNKNKAFAITNLTQITFKMALFIGIFQLLALIPGTSRSGATIIGAMLLGISRETGTKFTFYLAVPVMFGASLLKLVKYGFAFSQNEAAILLSGMAAAFIVSIVAIRFLMNYIKKHSFTAFGVYRIVLGLFVFSYFYFA